MRNLQRGFMGALVLFAVALVVVSAGGWWLMNHNSNTMAIDPNVEKQAAQAASAIVGTEPATQATSTALEPVGKPQTLAGGLIVQDVRIGVGAEAKKGDTLAMHYVGTLDNGTVFDSSVPRGQPFVFPLGAGQVIKGWDEGIVGMKVGGVRRLTIPPSLGYGAQANGPIPANSTLHFDVELIAVK